MQKRILRIILDEDYTVSGEELLCKLKWLPFSKRVKYNECILMFKVINKLCPNYLDCNNLVSNIHEKKTRSATSGKYLLPRFKTEKFKSSFKYSGPSLWNDLPESVSKNTKLSKFKYECKKHFLHVSQ